MTFRNVFYNYLILINMKKLPTQEDQKGLVFFFCIFFGGQECVGHSFAYVAHFVFFRDACIRTRELPCQAGALPT
jgi:hypothetical protein